MVSRPTKRSYSFEFKLAVVERFLAGEPATELAAELELSSPQLVQTWVRTYRREGAGGLRPKPKGRRPRDPDGRRARSRSWSSFAGRTSGCGQRTPTWENCEP